MKTPAVTILMPVYNAETYLRESIDSMLAQTFRDFEFLIIDDGSNDRSVEIILSYTDPRIRLEKNISNLGISATLNKGIELATAEFIARMDADDISYPSRLQLQYDYMVSHPDVALLSAWARVVDEDGRVIRQERFSPAYYYYNMNFTCWIYHPTVMFRKSVVKQLGYSVPFAEDFELFWQLMREYKFYNLPEFLLDYRVTGQSLHQVVKKNEYEEAQYNQVKRNIAYFIGSDVSIPHEYLQCFRLDFIPLLEKNKVKEVRKALALLKKITVAISLKKGINCDEKTIHEAHYYKRRFILLFFARRMKRRKGLWLLMTTSSWKLLYQLAKEYFMTTLKMKPSKIRYSLFW
jgi:glycosyltransferase involved in cell wall biosynthesis